METQTCFTLTTTEYDLLLKSRPDAIQDELAFRVDRGFVERANEGLIIHDPSANDEQHARAKFLRSVKGRANRLASRVRRDGPTEHDKLPMPTDAAMVEDQVVELTIDPYFEDAALTAIQDHVFRERSISERQYQEIAAECGITEGNARVIHSRAVKKFRISLVA